MTHPVIVQLRGELDVVAKEFGFRRRENRWWRRDRSVLRVVRLFPVWYGDRSYRLLIQWGIGEDDTPSPGVAHYKLAVSGDAQVADPQPSAMGWSLDPNSNEITHYDGSPVGPVDAMRGLLQLMMSWTTGAEVNKFLAGRGRGYVRGHLPPGLDLAP